MSRSEASSVPVPDLQCWDAFRQRNVRRGDGAAHGPAAAAQTARTRAGTETRPRRSWMSRSEASSVPVPDLP
jgi:hypothetical protein